MKPLNKTETLIRQSTLLMLLLAGMLYSACSSSTAGSNAAETVQQLPVLSISSRPVTTFNEFTASLQGSRDIEIRPQVDGYLEAIYVDEGAYVHKGQSLFKIDSRPYAEQLNNAKAQLLSAKAALQNASIEIEKLKPLIQNNVVSDLQLKSAQAAFNAAKANVAQAKAQVQTAKINLGYTSVAAPADGYIGMIPFKAGSLVGRAVQEPLTVLSETREMHAYFTMSEVDFINFKNSFKGGTIQEKIASMPPVELILADNTVYPEKGEVEIAEGQFDKTTGTISFRASFPNASGLIRSGNTGKIRIPHIDSSSLLVPMEATYELQDKVFVYVLNDSSKVEGRPLTIAGKSGNFYLVSEGLKAGEKIVYSGIDRLRDGMAIKPQPISADSLLRSTTL